MQYFTRLIYILSAFRGAIDRRDFWIGMTVIAVAYLFSPFRPPTLDGLAGAPTIASEIWTYAWLVPLAAVAVKRVNDIGWPTWLGYAFTAIVGLSFIPWSIGLLPLRPAETSYAASLSIYAFLLIWLASFVVLAFAPAGWRPSRYWA